MCAITGAAALTSGNDARLEDAAAAGRGAALFGGKAAGATCHVPTTRRSSLSA
jgi:hypothetical protein